ncbi:MAG TPA: NUDIX domain-containing protein [Candidatus Nanoarchaeia archaeon]|nr:NUDIX domain-containing protein [Candidatus Nanoarchaeia archaeon]
MAKTEDEIFKFKRPGVAVDVILFTIKDGDLQAGLIKREEPPYSGKYALPGRFVRYEEQIEETARQALKIKGGIDPHSVFLEQLYTFGQNLERDTRIRTISIVYYGLISANQIYFQKGNKFQWFSVYKLPQLAFDHKNIIDYAVNRLRKKVWESDFAFQLMAEEFTLTELQKSYEVILNDKLDKRNFRKKILEINILKDLHKKKMEGVHRPASLYSFKKAK